MQTDSLYFIAIYYTYTFIFLYLAFYILLSPFMYLQI